MEISSNFRAFSEYVTFTYLSIRLLESVFERKHDNFLTYVPTKVEIRLQKFDYYESKQPFF